LLYQYYLLGEVREFTDQKLKNQERIAWLNNCQKKEKYLREKVDENLKEGWHFSHLPPLEKAILISGVYELLWKNGNRPNN